MRIATYSAAAGLLALILAAGPAGAAILTVDQQALGPVVQIGLAGNGNNLGQSFVPTLSSIDAVSIYLNDATDYIPGPATAEVKVLSGVVGSNGLGGAVLAISAPVTFTNYPDIRPIEFDLGSPLSVIPGATYVLEVVGLKGAFHFNNVAASSYPTGQYFQSYYTPAIIGDFNLQFTEGLTTASTVTSVPCPSPLAVLCVALVGLAAARRRMAGVRLSLNALPMSEINRSALPSGSDRLVRSGSSLPF